MSIASKVIGYLGGVFNLFPLGGINGGVAIRQKGGTPGTSELQLAHAGASGGSITNFQGALNITQSAVADINISPGAGSLRVSATIDVNESRVRNGGFVSASASGSTSRDVGLQAVAVGVWRSHDGTTPNWLQQTAGRARLTADVTNVTTTFANLTDLTITVKAGRKYTGWLCFPINQALAADGFKFDLNGGTATVTDIEFGFSAIIGATLGTRTSTALATAITLTALGDTNDVWVEIPVGMTVNGAGTIIPRQAKNADAAGGTLTIRKDGFFWLDDSPN